MADHETTSKPRRPFLVRAALAGLAVLLDLGLVAIVAVAWNAHRLGYVSLRDIAALSLLGGSAAIGCVVLSAVVATNLAVLRSPSAGQRMASTGLLLAWLRLAGLVAAAAAIAVAMGAGTLVGLTDTFTVALAFFDAMVTIAVAGVTARAVRTIQ